LLILCSCLLSSVALVHYIVMVNVGIENLAIYCVYVRNHSEIGTFQGVLNDLPRFV
jgi:hypothetical protein